MSEPVFAQVKTNPRFERGWNRLQTGIQVFVAVVVIAGLLGLFGTGPLSAAKDQAASGAIAIRYERVLRRTVQTDVDIAFSHVPTETLSVDMPSSFVREMDIVSTSPRSTTMRATADGVAYLFDIKDADKGVITLSMKPKGFGMFASHFRVADADVLLRQFVWP